ncbi:hypothetical protein KAR91_64335 [Candidatus Pacearchaeota archaeon]|nr:hypothetical protein [Candidatus Pacearchaeota archaeon]
MKLKLLCILLILGAIMLYPNPAIAQDYSKSSVLFGTYRDFDAKESGYQNWTPFIGVSVPLDQSGRFYGIMGGEYGKNDVGDEYAMSPTVIMYLGKTDAMISKFISVNAFVMFSPIDVTWADVQDQDEIDVVAYILTSTGFGLTIGLGEKMKLWSAYQTKANVDYSTTRVGLGIRWAVF